jgi:hypothetical protein
VVRGVLGARVGVDGGRRSERGLSGRYVHRRRRSMVDDFSSRVRPRRSLADS